MAAAAAAGAIRKAEEAMPLAAVTAAAATADKTLVKVSSNGREADEACRHRFMLPI